jgi:polysaccharide biosynthesis transport protein
MLQDRLHMLQNSKTQTVIDDVQSIGAAQPDGLAELVDWTLGLLRRQYLVILFVSALVLGMGIVYLAVATPIYTAKTNIYIDLHKNPIDQPLGIFGNDPIEIESQIQILKSTTIASSVIKKLQLMNDPELDPSVRPASHLFELFFGTISASKSESGPMDRIVAAFQNNLTIEPVGGRVIAISYSSPDPERAASIANAIANAYITDQLEAKYEANRVATNWLQQRQQQLREQADGAQRTVESFKKQNDIVTTDGKPLDNVQVAELNNRLVAARAQTADISARLARLEAITRLGPSDKHVDGAISEISSPIVTTLRQQYIELARRESEWSVRFGKDHLAVVNLRNRMQEIRNSLFDELRQAAETAKNDYEIAKQRQAELERQLAGIVAQSRSASQAQVTLSGLESGATAYRKLYDSFLQQYMGTTQQATFPITEARVISAASPPLEKSKPKTWIVLALSFFGGIGLGLGFGTLRDTMDRVFRTAKQLESELQVPCVALVPFVKNEKSKQSWHKTISLLVAEDDKAALHAPEIFRTVIDSPLSSFSEAIRSIKLTIDLHIEPRQCKIIGMTSTIPNEGKSTIAAALAHLIAQVGGRVLLVDCDLRNPTLSRMLSRGAAAGIFDVVAKRTPAAEAILKEPKSNIAFLPAGKRIPLFLTSEVLGSESMTKLFDALRQNYDYILVDLPPLSPIIDVRASTHFIDAYLLTVEWGRTKIDAVEQSLRSAPKIYDSLIGTILNKTDMDTIRRYDSSGRYDRNKHYSRYGYMD